jgi:hypothetical protein
MFVCVRLYPSVSTGEAVTLAVSADPFQALDRQDGAIHSMHVLVHFSCSWQRCR